MRSTWVTGLVVAMALLGSRSAQAQGICTELTLYGDRGTTAGCGDTRSSGTLLVQDLNGTPGIDCPGTNCDGNTYRFSDSSDLIRVVLAGMHHDDADNIGMQGCNSDVRWSIVETWQNLFEGTCTDSTCENAQHLWRTPDDDAATATFLELLGLPSIEAEPFCNGDELEDNDPIRRPCAEGEDVCQPSGTLGLVLPIVPGPGSTEPCSLGVFRWKILPFTRFDCPQGINPLFGLCLQPQDTQGNFGCLNPAFNTSFGTPAGVDGRVHNLWALNADGTAPVVNGKELVAALDRIHTANTIAPGASVCLEPTASARIECLSEASPCSLGTECKEEPQRFACSEQGIRDAIAAGGGPHYFDCPGPTTVTTTSEIAIDNDVILDGQGTLTVDGQDDHPLFYVESETVGLRGFVITGGNERAIHNTGILTISDSTVTGNTASDFGGGIANEGILTVTNSAVSNNSADGGGGIANFVGEVTLIGSEVSGNEARLFGGGGVFNYAGGSLTLVDSTVSGNTSLDSEDPEQRNFGGGGGIYSFGLLSLTNSTVSGNNAVDGSYPYGGGIRFIGEAMLTGSTVTGNSGAAGGGIASLLNDAAAPGSILTLVKSEVSDNTAFLGGGILSEGAGVALSQSRVVGNEAVGTVGQFSIAGGIACAVLTFEGELTLEGSEVSDNEAPAVGGIASGCMLEMVNSTVSGNRATEASGGGISSDGPALLLNSTVANNTAVTEGSGINNFGEMTVVNTIIEGACEGTVISGGYNIESPDNTCGLTGTGDQHSVLPDGPSGLNLGPLQGNGGPTLTHAPQAPSAAINQIPLAACEVTTDQRGEPRPETGGSMCDVGAVEVQLP